MLPNNLLTSPQERLTRAREKQQKILRFLRQEIWSSQEILGMVMGIQSRTTTHKNLVRLETDGLLKKHTITGLGGGTVALWGITSHGQAMAFDPATETPIPTYFEPGKVAEVTVKHALDLQRLRVIAEFAGWHGWVNGDRMPDLLKGGKRPDAVAISPDGMRTAVEIERTIKTTKRYEQVLASYLMALKAGQVDQVVWLTPTMDIALRLQAIVFSIRSVTIQKQRFSIDPDKHHARLFFKDYSSWPGSLQGTSPTRQHRSHDLPPAI
jgi:hypothetical protein